MWACTRGASGGRNFVEYGVAAARDALADAGLDVDRRAVRGRRRHHPQRLPRLHRGRDVRAGARLVGRAGRELLRGVRLGRAARSTPRARRSWPGSATSRSWSAPTPRRRASSPRRRRPARRPRLAALPPARRHQPDLLRARTPAGAWRSTAPPSSDFARSRSRTRATGSTTRTRATARRSPRTRCSPRRWWPTRCACSRSAPPATAARPSSLTSMEFARRSTRRSRSRIAGVSTVTPRFPNTVIEMPNFATDSACGVAPPEALVPRLDRRGRVRGGGHRPRRPRPRRGLRPLVRARARLVREHRPLQGGRGRAAAERRRHHASAGASR